jgi:uncharacterized membrane protein
MRKLHLSFAILLIVAWLVIPSITTAQSADEPVVRAILFYSPTCGHCHYVITEVLIPMTDDYGDRLQIVGVDTSQPGGGQLYQAVIERYQIPRERQGVPTLVVGNVVLVGDLEIPEQFPTIVDEGLAADGIGGPDIPGLAQALPPEVQGEPAPTPESQATPPPTPTAVPQATATLTATATPEVTATPVPILTAIPSPSAPTIEGGELSGVAFEAPPPDPVGFTLAGVVLVGMIVAIGYTVWHVTTAWPNLFQLDRNPTSYAQTWAIPILSLIGLGVATYLAYVEISHIEAVCGPVGECNIVQSSPYAQILGIPIAVLGMLNYLAIGALWAGQKSPISQWANLSVLGLVGLTLFGAFFSIYLTCLELFVIHAICAWCLTSAVATTTLMLLVIVPVTRSRSKARA